MPPSPVRLLFVVPPLSGHVNPTVALGAALTAGGHAVAWAGSELFVRPLLGPAAELYGTGSKPLRPQAAGEASVRTLWTDFVVPYATFTAKAVDRAIGEFRPDVVIADEHAPAGALAAERRGLPWVTLATSAMELGNPWPRHEEWILQHLRGLWTRFGLDPAAFTDPRASPRLVIATSSPALTPHRFPGHYALVGPMLGDRPAAPDFPWDRLAPARRRVLVTLGTLADEEAVQILPKVRTALAGLDVQGVVAGAEESAPGLLMLPRVPTLELFGRGVIDAVLCHGGLNTVSEALAHGIPVVAAPIRHDQPITADRLAASGAGLRIDIATSSPEEIRGAVASVLDDPAHRLAARRIAERFAADGGTAAAVARLETFATIHQQGDPA